MSETAPAPVARLRDAPATRARILAAAQAVFSTTGYAGAGIRQIAAVAETSTTLLIRYYGSKAGLYEAALTAALTAADMSAMPRERLGEYLAAQFDRPDIQILPPAMMALAAGDAAAAAITARVVETHAIAPVAAWLGGAGAHARATRIFMLTTSYVLYDRSLPVLPRSGPERAATRDWLAVSIQALVDG